MASTQIPNYETRSLANNLKSKNQELSSLLMTYRINAMHALIKFPEYIPYGLELWPGHEVGRMEGQTHRINGMHALIKFPEYIPYRLGVMARTRSGTYGRTDRRTDGQTGRTGVILNALLLFFE